MADTNTSETKQPWDVKDLVQQINLNDTQEAYLKRIEPAHKATIFANNVVISNSTDYRMERPITGNRKQRRAQMKAMRRQPPNPKRF